LTNKDYTDRENTGLVRLFDGTTIDPLQTNANYLYTFVGDENQLRYSIEDVLARCHEETGNLENVRNLIDALNSFAQFSGSGNS